MKTLFLALLLIISCTPREDDPKPANITKVDSYGTWKVTQTATHIPNSFAPLEWQPDGQNRTVTISSNGTFNTYKFPQGDMSGTVFYQQDPAYMNLLINQYSDLKMVIKSPTDAEITSYDTYNPKFSWKLKK